MCMLRECEALIKRPHGCFPAIISSQSEHEAGLIRKGKKIAVKKRLVFLFVVC